MEKIKEPNCDKFYLKRIDNFLSHEDVKKISETEKSKKRCQGGITRIRDNNRDGYICRTCGLYEEYRSFWFGDKKILKHFGLDKKNN